MTALAWLVVAVVVGVLLSLAVCLVAGAGRLERERREATRGQR